MSVDAARVNHPIATRELERRWTAIRSAMEHAGVDVLLAQASNDFVGGYVKYLTDLPATNGYVTTVVFPRDEPMTVIGQGPFGLDRSLPVEGDGLRRGVGLLLGTPSYASAHYTAGYDAELAGRALEPYAGATVGLLGTAAISHALVEGLRGGPLWRARFVDASELVDPIKAVKSADELELVRLTARAQDEAMRAAFEAVEPGMRELEVAAIAEQVGHSFGSEQGLFLAWSGPAGEPGQIVNRHVQRRVLSPGDQFSLLIESNGPGGFYCELGRTIVLGEAPEALRAEHEFVLEAQRFCLERLTAGAASASLWREYNEFVQAAGRPVERRLHFHGQGYDMVERPLIRFDETMAVQASSYFALHPSFNVPGAYSWICDNFLLDAEGRVERLHGFPQELFERA
ncbi:MAG: M24 family metallopeptidase [Solirubrobacteraceae bacterium]